MKEEIKIAARMLRKNQTEGEKILWKRLRNRGFMGKKFIRQHPIIFDLDEKQRFFIADFFCNECKLVVEIDGKVHLNQREYDQYRDLIIQELGYKVIRVSNDMLLEEMDQFLNNILRPNLVSFHNSPPGPLSSK
jgi:very-short-patch-repair endonuclease